tara:strand:+ start:307 stop:804 length:498 start_codon:yes stop_codon:yes gene_type:complete
MIFKKKHNHDLYNTLLHLSRNIFFYKKVELADNFENRIYLMLFHFSILLKIYKKKGTKFDQNSYDSLFFDIENNLRESGLGDVAVNAKMKLLNKVLYDILLKFELEESNTKFLINKKVVLKYFRDLEVQNVDKYKHFETYFTKFYYFCFELPMDNMILGSINFEI